MFRYRWVGFPLSRGKYQGIRLKLVRELEAEAAAAPTIESTLVPVASPQ